MQGLLPILEQLFVQFQNFVGIELLDAFLKPKTPLIYLQPFCHKSAALPLDPTL
jgi:hypothetical protein